MVGLLFFAFFGAWIIYHDAKNAAGLRWYEIRGVTKFLFLGPPAPKRCRACDAKLPDDPLFWVELSPGVYVCEDCEEPIKLEAGLILPEWFEQPLPPEGPEVPKQVETPKTYRCANCGQTHEEDHICMEGMKKWDMPGGAGGTGQLLCPNPAMNTVIVIEGPPSSLPHNCHFCAKPIVMKGLCDKCILWGAPTREPCNTCTYHHEYGTEHPQVFSKAYSSGKLHDFIYRRMEEGYKKESAW